MYCLIFLLFANSFAKKLCFTSQSFNYNCYDGESFLNVNSSTDLTTLITEKMEESDTEITISLFSNFEYKFPLNIFNSKKVNILFSSPSSGKFNVSGIQNIGINLQGDSYSSTNVEFQYDDKILIAPQSSISLINIELISDITEIQLKSLSLQKSTFSFSKITLNSLNYQVTDKNIEVTHNNEDITVDGNNFVFTGDNQSLSLILSAKYDLIFNNQATTKSITYFNFNSIQSITFNGNSFLDSCYLSFKECSKVITNIDILPISSFSLGSSFYSSNFEIQASKSLSIKGELKLESSSNLIFETNDCSSRISISVDSIKLNSGNVQFKSSWIDLTVGSFSFNSQNLPVCPCIGSGGSSTSTFNSITYGGTSTLSFIALNINLDVSGPQTDETLSTLMSQEWNAIVFKSFTSVSAVERFDKITYSPNDINGFMDEPSIMNAKSDVSEDYVVTLSVSSYTTVPLLLCYSSSSYCSYGTAISDLTQLSTMIPAAQKMINLTITKSGAEIDLSEIKTTGATFTISFSYSSYYISSLKMSEPSEDANIEHLILKSTSLYTGTFQLNAKEIDISSLSLYSSSEVSVSINEKSVLNIDANSLKTLAPHVTNAFPMTNVNGISSNYYSSLEITDSEYILKGSYYSDIVYPKEKFSDLLYQIEVSSTYSFPITTSTSTIDSVTVQFVPSSTSSSSTSIQVIFNNLTNIVSAENICIDFGSFDNTIIDLKNFPKKSYFNFIGNNVQILNQGIGSDSSLCTCKELPCQECPQDLTIVSYDELNQKIQEISGNEIQITVIGSNDNSLPILSLSDIDNKDATIIGAGTNPKIGINCSTSFMNETTTIEFTKIAIIAHSPNDNGLQISNLKLYSDCIVDSSFNGVSLTVGCLDCDVSHLVFKNLLIQRSLILDGDLSDSQSSTKIAFKESAKFESILPATITINNHYLTFSNLQFDLSNVVPSFSIPQELSEFNIIGVDGNIDTLGSDIIIPESNTLQSIHVYGTWVNENPSKFFIFNNIKSDLHLQSENSPISFQSSSIRNIIIEKESVGIAGNLSLVGGSNYKISSTITGESTIKIQEIYTSSPINLQFASPTISMIINTIRPGSRSFKFHLKIGLEDMNKLEIINKIEDAQFDYEIECIVSGSLKDEKIKDFIEDNHTLIVVNHESVIKTPSDSNLKFTNAPQGFNNDNFKLIVEQSQLVFYTYKSPYESETNLYYGYCFLCTGTEITNEDFSHIEKFIPADNTSLTITFAKSAPADIVLDFDKDDIKNLNLKLTKSSSFSSLSLDILIKFGSSVSSLTVEEATLTISGNDDFSIQNAEFKDAKFEQPENYNHINSLSVVLNSLFSLNISEFSNELNIIFDTSSFSINYTKTGIKIIPGSYSSFNPFDIDISKLTNVNMLIKSSPKINLEEGVTELKQVNSLIFDYDTINIGSNWNQLSASSKVKYTLTRPINEVTVVTCSFPFESWDLMYGSEIAFDPVLSPYTFTDKFTLDNRNITLKTSTGSYSSYTITFSDVVLIGDSAISCIRSNNGNLIIENVTIKGNSNILDASITSELTLETGSSISGNFLISNTTELNIEWNLNEVSLFNPLSFQSSIPHSVNIIYKGSSISGKEREFDEFLTKGAILMKNVDAEILNKINFESLAESIFNESESLILKCQMINNNEIQMTSTRPFIDHEDQSGTNVESEQNSNEEEKTNSIEEEELSSDSIEVEEQSNSNEEEQSISSQIDVEEQTKSNEVEKPSSDIIIPTPIANAPSIDDSYVSTGSNVIFAEDGYYDGTEFISTKGNKNDILLIKTEKQEMTLTTNNVGQPNSALFISPKNKNAVFTITSPKDDNYGTGQVGIHTNSNNPSVKLPKADVPLNVFNNEEGSLNIMLTSNQKSKLLDDNQISLGKLIISGGRLQMKIPNKMSKIEFENVEAYLNNTFNAINDEEEIGIAIESLTMNQGSSISTSNVLFEDKIITKPNSRIEVNGKVRFDEETKMEMSDSSFIELGESKIKGTCQEIKVVKEKSANSLDDSEEVNAKLICGKNLDCSAWKQKYSKDDFYKYAKCIEEDDEVCLVASNKGGEQTDKKKKNSLSGGAIAGIIIAVVVVLIVVIVVVVVLQKSTRNKRTIGYIETNSQIEEEFNL